MGRVICWESPSVLVAREKRAERNPGDLVLAESGCGIALGFRSSESGAKQETEEKLRGQGVKVACEPCRGHSDCRQLLSPQKGTPRVKSH